MKINYFFRRPITSVSHCYWHFSAPIDCWSHSSAELLPTHHIDRYQI